MVIYDKNQFRFNIIFTIILISSLFINIYYATNFKVLDNRFIELNQTLSKVEDNQNFNFIQGAHNEIEYYLTPAGFFIATSDDFGLFNGPSMQPTIYDGNLLIEARYNKQELKEGHIIRFMRDDGTAVIHRVRADYGDRVYVQGDSLKDGEIINKDQITHLVIGVLFT